MFRSRVFSIVACVFGCIAVGAGATLASAQPATLGSSEIKSFAVPGAVLHYTDRGKGPLIVLVHGSLGELSDWDADANVLSLKHRVIAYSRRFHEPNDPPKIGQAYSMRQHADDLAALIRANGGKANLVGHSYGAYTSLYVAAHHPELVRTLVLAEPPVLSWLNESPAGKAVLSHFRETTLTPARDAFQRGDMVDGMRRFVNGVSGKTIFDQLPAPARADFMRTAPELRAEMTTDRRIWMASISCSEVHRFNGPVLIVSAEKSPAFYRIIEDRLLKCLPHAELVTINGVSHGGMLAPPAFTSVVEDFLSRHSAETADHQTSR